MGTSEGRSGRWRCTGLSFLCTAVSLAVAACGDSPSVGGDVRVRDSLGVTIVESSEGLEGASVDWRVSEQPDLIIGAVAGDDPYELFRVEGAGELPDGRIAVVNAGTQEIRYFDSEGRYQETTGGQGAGPGEFQMPRLIPPLGRAGELLVWDRMANRFTVLGPDGDPVRTVTPETMVQTPEGWDGAETVLSRRTNAAAGLDTPEGVMVSDVRYEAVPLGDGEPVFITEFPGRVYHAQIDGRPWFRPIPLDPRPSATAGGGSFYLTTGAVPEIEVYTRAGELVRIIRVRRDPEPVRDADVSALVERELSAMTDEDLRGEWRNHYGQMPVPETMPVYTRLLMDDPGHIWAEHFRTDPDTPSTWSVFDADGAVLGTIRTPSRVSIFQIGEDFLMGTTENDLGVEQVVRHRLTRR